LRCLQTLEIEVDEYDDIKYILLNTRRLKELTMLLNQMSSKIKGVLKHWIELEMRPSTINIFAATLFSEVITKECFYYATQRTAIHTANFSVYYRYNIELLNFIPTFPSFQLQFKTSGQVTTPCVKLSDFGILGMNNDVAVMTDCQYGERTMYMVRYLSGGILVNSSPITRCDNLSCVTHFGFTNCYLLHSGHLEQLAIVCPNIKRLNLKTLFYLLEKPTRPKSSC